MSGKRSGLVRGLMDVFREKRRKEAEAMKPVSWCFLTQTDLYLLLFFFCLFGGVDFFWWV